MKTYTVDWELVQYGTSKLKANSLAEARKLAEGSVDDFGDPKQFTPDSEGNLWQVCSVTEEA